MCDTEKRNETETGIERSGPTTLKRFFIYDYRKAMGSWESIPQNAG
jgi:hypothetical protein